MQKNALFVCAAFAVAMKLSLSQPMISIAFTFPVLSLIHLVGEQVSGWLWLKNNTEPAQNVKALIFAVMNY